MIVYNATNLAKNLRRAKDCFKSGDFLLGDCISFRFVKSCIYVFNPGKANDEFQDMKHIELYDSS